jgi:hypothetical protein
MAGGSNASTTVSTLAKGYRKKATKLYTAFKDKVEEFSWLDDIDKEDITVSGRENLIPLDIKRGYGAHMVSDGAYEARTVTPAMNEGSFSLVQANSRFFISTLAQALDERAKEAQIIRQIKYQSKKSLEALARRVGLQFYGISSGVVCETTTNATATTQTLTLNDGFGDSTMARTCPRCSRSVIASQGSTPPAPTRSSRTRWAKSRPSSRTASSRSSSTAT